MCFKCMSTCFDDGATGYIFASFFARISEKENERDKLSIDLSDALELMTNRN